MSIDFAHNARPTVGVEMELHLVDVDTGDLVSIANEVLDQMGAGHPGGEHPKAKHELFQSTIEVITSVCDTPEQLRAISNRPSTRCAACSARTMRRS